MGVGPVTSRIRSRSLGPQSAASFTGASTGGYQFGQVQRKHHQKMILDLDGQLQHQVMYQSGIHMFISAAFL